MIYTIGNKSSYDKAYAEAKAQGLPVLKLGRKDGYSGGYAFLTREDAERRIKEAYQDRGFEVYGLDAIWFHDTVPDTDGWWHSLIRDKPIIFFDKPI